jgi:hypothetical protein
MEVGWSYMIMERECKMLRLGGGMWWILWQIK